MNAEERKYLSSRLYAAENIKINNIKEDRKKVAVEESNDDEDPNITLYKRIVAGKAKLRPLADLAAALTNDNRMNFNFWFHDPDKEKTIAKKKAVANQEYERIEARKELVRAAARDIRDRLYLKEETYAGILSSVQAFEKKKF